MLADAAKGRPAVKKPAAIATINDDFVLIFQISGCLVKWDSHKYVRPRAGVSKYFRRAVVLWIWDRYRAVLILKTLDAVQAQFVTHYNSKAKSEGGWVGSGLVKAEYHMQLQALAML